MATQDTIMLNDYLARRERTTSNGTKTRYTISIKSDVIAHDLDPKSLGLPVAEAIRDLLARKVRDIAEPVKIATIAFRQRAKVALAAAKPWATRRYSGGRTGPMEPNQTVRFFSDSGRFGKSLHVQANDREGGFTINVAANRLDPQTFNGGEEKLVEVVARLVALVPEFADASLIAQDAKVRDAVADGIANRLLLIGKDADRLKAEIRRRGIAVLRQLAQLAQTGTGLAQ